MNKAVNKKELSGFALGGFLKVLGAVLSFLVNLKIATSLGAEGAGAYTIVIQLSMLLAVVVLFGSDKVLLKVAPSVNGGELSSTYRYLLKKIACRWGGISGFSFFICWFFNGLFFEVLITEFSFILISLITLLIAILYTNISLMLIDYGAYKAIAVQSVLLGLVNLAILSAFELSVEKCALGYLLGSGFCVFVSFYFVRHYLLNRENHCSGKIPLSLSAPFFLIMMSDMLIMNLDIIVLGMYWGVEVTGVYAIASRSAAMCILYSQVVDSHLSYKFSRLYIGGDFSKIRSIFLIYLMLSIFMAGLVFLGAIIFSESFMGLFGQEFSENHHIFIWLIAVQLVPIMFSPVAPLLNMCGEQNVLRNAKVFGAASCVLLNFILVPKMGVLGCIFALVVASPLMKFLCFLYTMNLMVGGRNWKAC